MLLKIKCAPPGLGWRRTGYSMHERHSKYTNVGLAKCRQGRVMVCAMGEALTPFPCNYRQVIQQSQTATQAALDDGKKLIEVTNEPAISNVSYN